MFDNSTKVTGRPFKRVCKGQTEILFRFGLEPGGVGPSFGDVVQSGERSRVRYLRY